MIKNVEETLINNFNLEQRTVNTLTNIMKVTRRRLVTKIMKIILLLNKKVLKITLCC